MFAALDQIVTKSDCGMPAHSNTHPVLPAPRSIALHLATACRAIERTAAERLPPHTLMARAGEAVARLALAIAPHARTIDVWCGPGNNGGDGFVAASWLRTWGKDARLIVVGDPARGPDDARHAWQHAREAGVPVLEGMPERVHAELAIDALLGLGVNRPLDGALASAVGRLNASDAPVLAIDVPSGLHSNTGVAQGVAVHAAHTVSLLALKPGLFTAHGRDHAGRVWFDDLGVAATSSPVELAGREVARALAAPRLHAQHKGSFGDAVIIGGAAGMLGAAALAARAALAAGAGRVYVGLLAAPDAARCEAGQPELMSRTMVQLLVPSVLDAATVVCGCGGGDAVREVLPFVLHHAQRLVLDADALNVVAGDTALTRALRARAERGLTSVLTPHPLEAARLLGVQSAEVQADRLQAADRLAATLQCTVLLKGSGSIVATPGRVTSINPTGDARLATAGTGDVLAGWLGGTWAAHASVADAHAVARAAAWLHGSAVDHAPPIGPLRASLLIEAIVAARAALHES
ncbi:MAG TPA: NAD(P)H-hydrate dehydratase [Burkholderiaceae bacterium]|nr:NAD(P)H-hydrate dehydratase [Burkholderiaceae bacterium]